MWWGKSSTLPILNNVLLEAKDNKLVVVGTDLDITVRTEVAVTSQGRGHHHAAGQEIRPDYQQPARR